jgi:hypothetical protein
MPKYTKTVTEKTTEISRSDISIQSANATPQTRTIYTFPVQTSSQANEALLDIHVTATDPQSSGAHAAGFVINAIGNIDGESGVAGLQQQNQTLHMYNGDGSLWTATLGVGAARDVTITVTGSATHPTIEWTVWTKAEGRVVAIPV